MDSSALAAAGLGLASAPHCMGMCGPIAGLASATRTGAVGYHAARLAAYAGAGAALAGLVAPLRARAWGDALGWMAAGLTAVALLASARRLLRGDVRPLLSPRSLVRRDRRLATAGSVGLGALTGLLPCGALYGALGVAALAPSSSAAAFDMFVFGVVSSMGLLTSQLAFRELAREGREAARNALVAVLVAGALLTLGRPIVRSSDAAPCHPMPAPGASR